MLIGLITRWCVNYMKQRPFTLLVLSTSGSTEKKALVLYYVFARDQTRVIYSATIEL